MNRGPSSLPEELRCELHRVQEAECQRLLSAYYVPATVVYSMFCTLGLRKVKPKVTELVSGQAQGLLASAPTLAELRHMSQGRPRVRAWWEGSGQNPASTQRPGSQVWVRIQHGPQPQYIGASRKAKLMFQEEEAQLGLVSRILFPLSLHAVGI